MVEDVGITDNGFVVFDGSNGSNRKWVPGDATRVRDHGGPYATGTAGSQ
jgi:hypothetical protein